MSRRRTRNNELDRMVSSVDNIRDFVEIFQGLTPGLKADLKKNLSPKQLIEKHQSLLTARLLSIAVTDPDSAKSVAACRDLLDRVLGKPTEKKEMEHKFSKLSDQELDAVLVTELDDSQEPTE